MAADPDPLLERLREGRGDPVTGPEELPAGVCVCGRAIPESSPSDWACDQDCQSAWLMHQANPDYPHPRLIRAGADARARSASLTAGEELLASAEPPAPVAEGTQIDVDGTGFVRVGVHWQQTGPWSPLRSDLATALEYLRWCPSCRQRRRHELHQSTTPGAPEGWQQCADCAYQWPGRPLVGVIETRGEPWPGIRMRLTDGYRSATHSLSEADLVRMPANASSVETLAGFWVRLERDLSNVGRNDQDQAEGRPARRSRRGRPLRWDWVPHLDPDTGRMRSPAS